jgi:Fe-S cluster assembly protein SufD
VTTALAKTVAEQALGVSLPSRRDEEWKWTDLRRLVDKPFVASTSTLSAKEIERFIAASPLAQVKMQRLIVVNGVWDEAQSKAQGLQVATVAPAIAHDDPLLALNGKLKAKTLALHFSGNVDQPVEVLHITTGENAAVASRLHVSVAKGGSAMIVETFVGRGDYLNNPVTTLDVGKGARLDRVKIETEAAQAQHLSHMVARLDANVQFNDFTLTAGSMLNRQNVNVDFDGQHTKAQVSGGYLLKGKQHADTRIIVDHKVPHCVSRELFKCVMDEQARGIFQGKVIVRKDAQKTDGKQSSHALLLSETAEFDAKPELEIYADDVVCGHGATCGDLNHDHLFYMMSRGIPELEARAMLVHAFVAEAIGMVEHEAVRDVLMGLVQERMR